MTNLEKCRAIIDIMDMCNIYNKIEENKVVGDFISEMYKTLEEKGSIKLLEELDGYTILEV